MHNRRRSRSSSGQVRFIHLTPSKSRENTRAIREAYNQPLTATDEQTLRELESEFDQMARQLDQGGDDQPVRTATKPEKIPAADAKAKSPKPQPQSPKPHVYRVSLRPYVAMGMAVLAALPVLWVLFLHGWVQCALEHVIGYAAVLVRLVLNTTGALLWIGARVCHLLTTLLELLYCDLSDTLCHRMHVLCDGRCSHINTWMRRY